MTRVNDSVESSAPAAITVLLQLLNHRLPRVLPITPNTCDPYEARSWIRSRTSCKSEYASVYLLPNITHSGFRNPGAKHDDEVLYGSGQSSDPVHTAVNPAPFSSGTLGHLADDGRTNEPSTAHDLDSTTGATTTMEPTGVTSTRDPTNSDPLSGTGTAAFDNMSGDRRGYEHDVGSTTAIREGVPGAPSGSGLSGSSTNKPLPNEPRSALAGSAYVQSDGSVRR